jgi:uncharacterized membrane protein YphA (DoxX/SURF4 family)
MSLFTRTPENILRVGIAFSFIYPPISAFFNPYAWVGYFPAFATTFPIDELVLLHIFGIIEICIAVWILCGKNLRIPLLFATTMLVAIVGFNMNQFDVLFRDVPIIGMCIALYLLYYPLTKK